MAGFGTSIVAADNSAEGNSTIINEEYSSEVTNVNYEETNINYENTDIDTTVVSDNDIDTTIIGDDNDVNTFTSGVNGTIIYNETNTEITDISNIYSDNDYNYTHYDNDNTTIGNNTEIYDNSYKSETIIQHIETTQVNMDNSKTVSIDIKNDNSVVNNVYFVPTKDAGKANVVVEDLKPECIKKPPAGIVYKSFNIFIDNGNKQVIDIDNAAVDFKVEKSWLIANGLDKSAIVLNMYEGGKWIEVPIKITSEDSKYIYFNAEVSEYSTFAITSKTITVDKIVRESNSQNNSSSEEIDGPTKSLIIKLLEFAIELLKGE